MAERQQTIGETPSRRALIFLGAPGVGKGTQAKEVARALGIPHLSTGDMFRDNVSRGTELGRQAQPIMEKGELVPDEIVLGMVGERIVEPDCAQGFILDGFPRTVAQAKKLDEILAQRGPGRPFVLYIDVPNELLLRRLTGRRTCKVGGEIYNIYDRPPRVSGRCDNDGGELVQRADDREEVIRERLAAYERQTRPLVDYYRQAGVMVDVDGKLDAAVITGNVLKVLGERK